MSGARTAKGFLSISKRCTPIAAMTVPHVHRCMAVTRWAWQWPRRGDCSYVYCWWVQPVRSLSCTAPSAVLHRALLLRGSEDYRLEMLSGPFQVWMVGLWNARDLRIWGLPQFMESTLRWRDTRFDAGSFSDIWQWCWEICGNYAGAVVCCLCGRVKLKWTVL